MRDAAVRKDCGYRRPEPPVAELPREVAELALFPAVPPGRLPDHGEGVPPEQPVTPDGTEVCAGGNVERDRREHPRVEIGHRETAVRKLEHLELEDALPPDRRQQLAHPIGQPFWRANR